MYLRDQWIGIMADKLDSQRMRGFGDAQTNDCDSRAAFAMKRLKKFKDKKVFFALIPSTCIQCVVRC